MTPHPWSRNFQGTVILIAVIVGMWGVGYLISRLGGPGEAPWLAVFFGSWVGWYLTRGDRFLSETAKREKETKAEMEGAIASMRSKAMETQRAGTMGCLILYWAIFLGVPIAIGAYFLLR